MDHIALSINALVRSGVVYLNACLEEGPLEALRHRQKLRNLFGIITPTRNTGSIVYLMPRRPYATA